jgi:hypothetical protein
MIGYPGSGVVDNRGLDVPLQSLHIRHERLDQLRPSVDERHQRAVQPARTIVPPACHLPKKYCQYGDFGPGLKEKLIVLGPRRHSGGWEIARRACDPLAIWPRSCEREAGISANSAAACLREGGWSQ